MRTIIVTFALLLLQSTKPAVGKLPSNERKEGILELEDSLESELEDMEMFLDVLERGMSCGDNNRVCSGNEVCRCGTCDHFGKPGDCCDRDDDCNNNRCVNNQCSSGNNGQSCVRDDDCDNRRCVQNFCRAGAAEDPCDRDKDCAEDRCVFKECSNGGVGNNCKNDKDCNNRRCVKQVCRAGGNRDPCRRDRDCLSSNCRDNRWGTRVGYCA